MHLLRFVWAFLVPVPWFMPSILWLNCEILGLLVGCECVAVAERTVARHITLAQARLTRPGETCKNRPGLPLNSCSGRELLFWARHYLAQARDARLSENAWKPWCVAAILAQARNLTFGRGVVSLKRGGLA